MLKRYLLCSQNELAARILIQILEPMLIFFFQITKDYFPDCGFRVGSNLVLYKIQTVAVSHLTIFIEMAKPRMKKWERNVHFPYVSLIYYSGERKQFGRKEKQDMN